MGLAHLVDLTLGRSQIIDEEVQFLESESVTDRKDQFAQ